MTATSWTCGWTSTSVPACRSRRATACRIARGYEPFSGPAFPSVPGYGTFIDQRAQNLSVSMTSALSTTWLNDVRVGYTRLAGTTEHENQGTSLNNAGGHAGAVVEPAGLRPELHHDQRLLAARRRVQQPAGEHDRPAAARRHHHVVEGSTSAQVRRRRPVRPAGRLPRRAVARLPHLLGSSAAHRQRARGSAASASPRSRAARGWTIRSSCADRAWRCSRRTAGAWRATSPSRRAFATSYIAPPVDRDDRANVYDPVDALARPGGDGRRSAWRLRVGSQQLRSAARCGVVAAGLGHDGSARRLWARLQPVVAGALRGPLLQPAVLQPQLLLLRCPGSAAHRFGSVPGRPSRCPRRPRRLRSRAIWRSRTSTSSM